MLDKNRPNSRKTEIVVQELKGELLNYDLRINKAFCLNKTSAMIWQLCDGENSISEIAQLISRKINSSVNEALVWLASDQLKKENLFSPQTEIAPKFNQMSRREVIKKVGLGTTIALPLISSVIAPTSLQAQSGSTCGNLNDLCTGAPQGTCCDNLSCIELVPNAPTQCAPCFLPGDPCSNSSQCCSTIVTFVCVGGMCVRP